MSFRNVIDILILGNLVWVWKELAVSEIPIAASHNDNYQQNELHKTLSS